MRIGNKECTNCIELIAEYNGRIGRLIVPFPDILMFLKWDDNGLYGSVNINDIKVKGLEWKKVEDIIRKKEDEFMINEIKPKILRYHKYFGAVKPVFLPRIKKLFEKDKIVELSADTVLKALNMYNRRPTSLVPGLKFVLWFEKIAVEFKSRGNRKVFIFSEIDENSNYKLSKGLEELAKIIEYGNVEDKKEIES